MAIQIHPDLKSLIPPLTPEEYAQLEANLLEDGCLDPLMVWQEEQILLDGHNRLAICARHDLIYTVQEVSLPDLDAAKAWLISHQLGRRNLTPAQMSYYRGEQYNLQKRQGKRTDLTSPHTEGKSRQTAHVLAAQHKVGKATVERDGAYARAVDTIAETVGPEARHALLSREMKLTQQEVKMLGDLLVDTPETVPVVQAALHSCDPQQTLQDLIATARWGPSMAGTRRTPTAAALPLLPEVLDPEPPAQAPSWPQTVSTGDPEWYTPKEILAPVRAVLGQIDVDPASCTAAQARVQARTYYTLADDGLSHPWHGKIFLNPPYTRAEITRFIAKLFQELDAGHTTEAILLVNNVTQTDWFQSVATRAAAICFPDGKIPFLHPTKDGLHPCSGQAICYFGPHAQHFGRIFVDLGVIMQAMRGVAPAQLPLAEPPIDAFVRAWRRCSREDHVRFLEALSADERAVWAAALGAPTL